MKYLLPVLALLICGGLAVSPLRAAETSAAPAPEPEVVAEVNALVEKVRQKLTAEEVTEATLADELKAFDALAEKYRKEKPEEAAQILYLQATLYVEVLDQTEKGVELLQRVVKEFPGTQIVEGVQEALAAFEKRLSAERAQKDLIGQAAPPLRFSWSSREGLESLEDLRGKVVVLDFWASWCGPCVATFPQIRTLVDAYKGYDVEIVGVTSVQGAIIGLTAQPIDCRGDPAKEMRLMRDYMKAKEMNWTVVFSEKDIFDAGYGVVSIPHLAIIDAEGKVRHTGLHPGMPKDELAGRIDALLKEAGKKAPERAE